MDLRKKTKCGHCGKEFYMLESHDMEDCFEALRKENARLKAKLVRVVEVLERCQCNAGECPCSYIALSAAKGEES